MQHHQGYTLLEILIVLVIISVVAVMAFLTVGHHRQRQLKAFSQELVERLILAQEQALLQPTTLALFFTNENFGFYEYHREGWKPLTTNSELSSHPLPSDIQIRLKTKDQLSAPTGDKPTVLITSNGNLSPFTLIISNKDKTAGFEIIGYKDGTVISHSYQD